MIIHIFQCYSLKSSHHLLPHSPKVCSLHLCLFCCLVYRVIIIIFLNSISVKFISVAQLCPTLCNPMNRSTTGPRSITNSWSSLRLTSIESVIPSSHLILCRPLLLLPSIPPSIRVFPNESALGMRWSKYWSSSFSISPSNEHPGLISFRVDWLDLLSSS